MIKNIVSIYNSFFFISLFSFYANAEIKLTNIKKISVFPISDSKATNAEDAWWQMREYITKDQKFLISSRRFMINRGVFQPRKILKPADAIILGKILDAHALVTSWVEERKMKMNVYDGSQGFLIWTGEMDFHPAIPINDQLVKASLKLISDFVSAMPFHGYQVIDDLIGQAVYSKDNKKFAQIYVGLNSKLQLGDAVQWIEVSGDISKAFFEQMNVITIAEGQVTEIKKDRIEVEITKMRDSLELKENSLVRFPSETRRLIELSGIDEKSSSLSAEYLSAEIKNTSEISKQTNPTVTTLAFIANLAGFLLLAF